jgi:hypothetical protein
VALLQKLRVRVGGFSSSPPPPPIGAAESAAADLDAWIRKRFKLSPEIEKQLLSISPRRMDRRLAVKKKQQRRRIYGRTKPGYLLKHHIPVKTDS